MLKPDVKLLWLQALLSGAYKQGQYTLRPEEQRYCCLGVLCDVAPMGKWTERGDETMFCASGERQAALPPPAVRHWAGLSHDEVDDLARMNDQGESFHAIARWIDENL